MSTFDVSGLDMDDYVDIVAAQVTAAQGLWGQGIDTSEDELLGHQIRQIAYLLAEINEALQQIYSSGSVSASMGARLDGLLELIGMYRQSDAYSTAVLTYTVDRPTTIPVGHRVKTAAGPVFATDVSLVFAAAGSASVAATCTSAGAINAGIGEISTIVNPVYGLISATNAAVAVPGRLRETDGDLKARHTIAVATSGDNDLASIYEAVTAVPGVSSVAVSEIPGYVSVSVIGGTDDAVAAAISNTLTAGIGSLGDDTADVYSPLTRQYRTINFTRAAEIPCYISVTLRVIPGVYPEDGEEQIKAALVASFGGYEIGDDVDYLSLMRPIYSVPGVVVTALYLSTVSPAVETSTLEMDMTQLATLATGDIAIGYTT